MVATRQEINDTIQTKLETVENLRKEIRELRIQNKLLCDEEQQYYEEEVDVVISKRPKKLKNNYTDL